MFSRRGVITLTGDSRLLIDAVGFALFDLPSNQLNGKGNVSIELVAPLDGRRYLVQRSTQEPEWTVQDPDTGYKAAAGQELVTQWVRLNFGVPQDFQLARIFTDLLVFSLPSTVGLLMEETTIRERKFAPLLRVERYPVGLRRLETVLGRADVRMQEAAVVTARLDGETACLEWEQQRCAKLEQATEACIAEVERLAANVQAARAEERRRQELLVELEHARREASDLSTTLAVTDAEMGQCRRRMALLDEAEARISSLTGDWKAYLEAERQVKGSAEKLARREALRAQLRDLTPDIARSEAAVGALQDELARVRQSAETAKALTESISRQQSLEQRLAEAQERAVRLSVASRRLQDALNESKRMEVLLAESERQIEELERLASKAARVRQLEHELQESESKLRDAVRQSDELQFLQAAIGSAVAHLGDLRKSVALGAKIPFGVADGNGAERAADRSLVAHLRQAIESQLSQMDKQIDEWQGQARELASAPAAANHLQAAMRKLESELDTVREAERRLASAPVLRQQRRQLQDRLNQLKETVVTCAKEQQECQEAPAQVASLRRELGQFGDKRAEQLALKKVADRQAGLESELRVAQRRLDDLLKKQHSVEQSLEELDPIDKVVAKARIRMDESCGDFQAYLAVQAVAEAVGTAREEFENAAKKQQAAMNALREAEALVASLAARIAELQPAPEALADQQTALASAEARLSERREATAAVQERLVRLQESRALLETQAASLARLANARQLLEFGRNTIARAEGVLGQRYRAEVAAFASGIIARLLEDPAVRLDWPWGGGVSLIRGTAAAQFEDLTPGEQACVAVALRLALLRSVSNATCAFIEGLTALDRRDNMAARLERVEGFQQIFVPSEW